jgi:septum formation protein
MTIRFVLASASPARHATLVRAGVKPEVIVSDVDESAFTIEAHAEFVLQLATAKAQAVANRLDGPALVLGCDSMLSLDGQLLGKPGGYEQSVARWQQLRGGVGVLLTGHYLLERHTGRTEAAVVRTTVRFADVTDDEIEAYCASGEPASVAGAFTIDGLGGWFVESVSGDPHNVVGLSLPALRRMLGALGYGLRDLGYPTGNPSGYPTLAGSAR